MVQVCCRLGLVSLAYLWRQPQARLLRDMYLAGIEAIMIKVASIGTCSARVACICGHHSACMQAMCRNMITGWQVWTLQNTWAGRCRRWSLICMTYAGASAAWKPSQFVLVCMRCSSVAACPLRASACHGQEVRLQHLW